MAQPTLISACCNVPPVSAEYTAKGSTVHVLSPETNDYLSAPPATPSTKAVIVVYDIFGMHPNAKQVADLLSASLGCIVLVPDFLRGIPIDMAGGMSGIMKYIQEYGDYDRIVKADLVRSCAWLKETHGVTSIGAVGLCWGGLMTTRMGDDAGSPGFEDVKAVATAHPSLLQVEFAEKLQVPLCMLPSKDEDPKLMDDIWAAVQKNPKAAGKSFHQRFDDMHHGWCCARGDYTIEAQKNRATEALNIFARFFKETLNPAEMGTSLRISPLPFADEDTQIGNSPYVYGYCGLEACFLRGLVHIDHQAKTPLAVASLKIAFHGLQSLSFQSEFSQTMNASKILVLVSETLLTNETIPPQTSFSIPFQLALPEPNPSHADLMRQSVRLANLMCPPSTFKGTTYTGTPYEGSTAYTLTAELQEQPSAPSSFLGYTTTPAPKTAMTNVSPFLVHDPRQLPLLMQPDSKRWRSAPGDSPLEYEIEIGSITLGAGDTFSFLYRLAVARDAAAQGVKVSKVTLVLREHKTLGTTVNIVVPPSYRCVKGSKEVARWEFDEAAVWRGRGVEGLTGGEGEVEFEDFGFEIEGDGGGEEEEEEEDGGRRAVSPASNFDSPRMKIKELSRQTRSTRWIASHPRRREQRIESSGIVEMAELRSRRKVVDGMSSYNASHASTITADSYDSTTRRAAHTFADGWSGGPGGDGLYCEQMREITMPPLSAFTPDTFKPSENNLVYPNPHNHIYQQIPYIEVKHTLQVRIELTHVSKPIVHECWCVVASVGQQECNTILDNRVELMPAMDYDKVFGNNVWVPEYTREDLFLGELALPRVPSPPALTQEDELDEFFGPLQHLIRNRPPPPPATLPPNHPLLRGEEPHNAPMPSSSSRVSDLLSTPTTRHATLARTTTPIPTLAISTPLGSPTKEYNYFQKRPSISSILSFTTVKHPPPAISLTHNSRPNSPGLMDDFEVDIKPTDFDTPPLTAGVSVLATRTSKMSINTAALGHDATGTTTVLPSAHTLLAQDATVTVNSPTNERMFREISAKRAGVSLVNAYSPMDAASSGGSSGDGMEEGEEGDTLCMSDSFVRHPLLGEEEVEARRRERGLRRAEARRGGGVRGVERVGLEEGGEGGVEFERGERAGSRSPPPGYESPTVSES
ncbi:hypothetical protein HDU98_000946 [Podochytrium sp. JEL0797]|nr:hypothetical protein HDU98_000946 [Podochytrium sp. JEL0797]